MKNFLLQKRNTARSSRTTRRKSKNQLFLIADNIRSRENIGSFFRTADALGVDKIFLCGISGTPPHQKISKTALGAELWIPWEYKAQTWRLVDDLKKQGVFVVCLEQTKKSVDIARFRPKFPLALVVGNEVNGV
ncbi:MAG: TrmH family RNA methyltransferase, partial [Candidatus Wildermuthbacteria bacterium]|nr:TrmH family RNA methyltransferase [Candidatus Wildermuthbacteria bacterium]